MAFFCALLLAFVWKTVNKPRGRRGPRTSRFGHLPMSRCVAITEMVVPWSVRCSGTGEFSSLAPLFFFSYLRCPSPDSRNERGKKEEEDEDEAEESPSSDGRRIEGPRSFGGFQNERRNISSDSGPLFIPCPSHHRLRKSSSRLAVGGSQGEYLFECLKKGPRKITPKRATPESRRSVG